MLKNISQIIAETILLLGNICSISVLQGFWQWFRTFRISGFLDFVHHHTREQNVLETGSVSVVRWGVRQVLCWKSYISITMTYSYAYTWYQVLSLGNNSNTSQTLNRLCFWNAVSRIFFYTRRWTVCTAAWWQF